MSDIFKELRPLIVIFVALVVLTGVVYPLVVFVIGQVAFPLPGKRQPDQGRQRHNRGLGAHRPAVHGRQILLASPVLHERFPV